MSLTQKIALITGASRGIGFEIANELANKGITIVGTATTHQSVENFKKSMKKNGFIVEGFILDVSDLKSIQNFFTQIKSKNLNIDILINNAGITHDNLMMRMSEYEWQSVINTNLNSIFRISKECIRSMMKKKWGRIISIGSVVSSTGNLGQTNYCSSKAGIIGFTKSLAYEVSKRNITVNVVAPGFINTDMTTKLTNEQKSFIISKIPSGSIGEPKDIAVTVAFLASNEAKYITGQTLHVNGGMYMV